MESNTCRIIKFLRKAKINIIFFNSNCFSLLKSNLPEEILEKAICLYIKNDSFIHDKYNCNDAVWKYYDFNLNKVIETDKVHFKINIFEFALMYYENKNMTINAIESYKLLEDLFKSTHEPCGLLYINETNSLVIYSNTKMNKKSNECVIYFSSQFTYGDCFMLHPIIKAFCSKKRFCNITFYHLGYISYKIYSNFLTEFNHKYVSCYDSYITEMIENINTKQSIVFGTFLDVNSNLFDEGKHISQFFMNKLGVNHKDIQYQLEKQSLQNKNITIDNRVKSNKKYKIGVQFYSDTNDRLNIDKQYPFDKNWTYTYAQEFVNLCVLNEHDVYQFTLHAGKSYKGCEDYSQWPYDQLTNIIRDLDVFVGIDSAFGHFSAFVGINSLTIFGGASAYWVYSDIKDKYKVSFVPLRRNYSISDIEGDIRNITPDIVYSKMLDILHNKICLRNSLVDYKSIQGCYVSK